MLVEIQKMERNQPQNRQDFQWSFAQGNKKPIATEEEKIMNKIVWLQQMNQFLVNNADSDIEAKYIAKPSHTHDEYDIMLGRLNPDSRRKSMKFDQNRQQMEILHNELMNLSKAKELLASRGQNIYPTGPTE